MNKIKIYILSISIITGLNACDNRTESFEEFNSPPEIGFYIKGKDTLVNSYQDSIKLNKENFNFSPITVRFNDPNYNIKRIGYEIVQGSGQLLYKDSVLNGLIPGKTNEATVKFKTTTESLNIINITITDRFNIQSTATYRVLSFYNLPPVAKLEVKPLKTVNALEYEINASGSFDQDKNFGGGIIKYTYQIGDDVFESNFKSIKYIFPSTGKFSISVFVTDNDNQESQVVTKLIDIN